MTWDLIVFMTVGMVGFVTIFVNIIRLALHADRFPRLSTTWARRLTWAEWFLFALWVLFISLQLAFGLPNSWTLMSMSAYFLLKIVRTFFHPLATDPKNAQVQASSTAAESLVG